MRAQVLHNATVCRCVFTDVSEETSAFIRMDQAGLLNMKDEKSFKTSEITHKNTTSPPQ